MKNLIIFLLLTTTLSAFANPKLPPVLDPPTNINSPHNAAACYQHDNFVGFVSSPSDDESIIGNMCFYAYKDGPLSEAAELQKSHLIHSPECWKGNKQGGLGSI